MIPQTTLQVRIEAPNFFSLQLTSGLIGYRVDASEQN
jgi:hypothetical protein